MEKPVSMQLIGRKNRTSSIIPFGGHKPLFYHSEKMKRRMGNTILFTHLLCAAYFRFIGFLSPIACFFVVPETTYHFCNSFSLFQQTTPLEQTIFCIPKEAVTIAGGHFRTFVGAAMPQMLIRQQRCPGNRLRDFQRVSAVARGSSPPSQIRTGT